MDLSMVIPVKEESENLPELLKEIVAAIEPTGMEFEVIIIDDGSRDNTWEVVEGLAKEYNAMPGSSVAHSVSSSTAARPRRSPLVFPRLAASTSQRSMATCRMTRSKSRR